LNAITKEKIIGTHPYWQ